MKRVEEKMVTLINRKSFYCLNKLKHFLLQIIRAR